MLKTTIVIPNYNGKHYLENCLDSLTKQSKTDFCVLVVDNGSTDGSVPYVKQYHNEVTLLCLDKNMGFCIGVNEGIKASKTEFVLLLNNDTTVDYNFVEEMERGIEESNRIFSVGAKMLSMKEPERIDDAGDYYCALGWAYALGKGKQDLGYNKKRRIFAACAGAAIYRKEVFQEIGFFDENHFAYLEDIDIGYRASIYGYQNLFQPKAIVYHAGSGFSGSKYNEFKIRLASKNSIYLIAKNMPVIQIIINLPFLVIGFFVKTVFFMSKGYGKLYLEGLGKGVAFSFSQEGKKARVPFQLKHLPFYLWIQLQLWVNIARKCLK